MIFRIGPTVYLTITCNESIFQTINFFFKLAAKIIVRAFSLNSQNYVYMTLICVEELNILVNVIIGCQTAEILKLKVAKIRSNCETNLTVSKLLHRCITCQWVGAP